MGKFAHHFTISELRPDGKVLIISYTRIGDQITCVMDLFDDGTLKRGTRYLDVQLMNGAQETVKTLREP